MDWEVVLLPYKMFIIEVERPGFVTGHTVSGEQFLCINFNKDIELEQGHLRLPLVYLHFNITVIVLNHGYSIKSIAASVSEISL